MPMPITRTVSSPARMPRTTPRVCVVSSRMRPVAVRAKPSMASWAAPTTVSPASIRTIPDATITDGRIAAAASRPV